MAFRERTRVKNDSFYAKISKDSATGKYIVDVYFYEKVISFSGDRPVILNKILDAENIFRQIFDEIAHIELKDSNQIER